MPITIHRIKRVCPHCGERIRKLNPHHMDKPKVGVLMILANALQGGNGWVHCMEGEKAIVNGEVVRGPYLFRLYAMRSMWFGLTERREFGSGDYRITRKGIEFLKGDVGVPATLYCKDGEVREQSEKIVFVGDVKNVVYDKEYWMNYFKVQKWPAV